jgi:hypothetical protein
LPVSWIVLIFLTLTQLVLFVHVMKIISWTRLVNNVNELVKKFQMLGTYGVVHLIVIANMDFMMLVVMVLWTVKLIVLFMTNILLLLISIFVILVKRDTHTILTQILAYQDVKSNVHSMVMISII